MEETSLGAALLLASTGASIRVEGILKSSKYQVLTDLSWFQFFVLWLFRSAVCAARAALKLNTRWQCRTATVLCFIFLIIRVVKEWLSRRGSGHCRRPWNDLEMSSCVPADLLSPPLSVSIISVPPTFKNLNVYLKAYLSVWERHVENRLVLLWTNEELKMKNWLFV